MNYCDANFIKLYSPYCVSILGNGRYIILNRYYKPIGIKTDRILNYDLFAIKTKSFTAYKIKEIEISPSKVDEFFFLYDGNTLPWHGKKNFDSYMIRVGILNRIKIENDPWIDSPSNINKCFCLYDESDSRRF